MKNNSYFKTTVLVIVFTLPWLAESAMQNHQVLSSSWLGKHLWVIPVSTTALFGLIFCMWANRKLTSMLVLRKRRILFLSNLFGCFVGAIAYAVLASPQVAWLGYSANKLLALQSLIVGFALFCCIILIKSGLYAIASRNTQEH